MLNRDDLVELYRDLRQEKVLSVYVDGKTNDFSERNLWRRRLEKEVVEARKTLEGAEPSKNGAFDRALSHVETVLGNYDQFIPDRGWVGFASSDGLVYGEPVRVPMPDLVRWETGIRVAPYVRALKQDRLVVTVLVDSRRARIFQYRGGQLGEPENLNAETFLGDLTDANVSRRAGGHTGGRGETGTDAAQRFLGVGSERMMKQLMDVVAQRAGTDGLLVIGGSPEAVSAAESHLPLALKSRTIEAASLRLEMSDSEVRDGLEKAASELNQTMQRELLDGVINQARAGGKGALGLEDVEKAVREGRVDILLLSRNFIRANPDYADHLVGGAFEQHGDVEELSAEGADRLDSAGEGVAARLRYVITT